MVSPANNMSDGKEERMARYKEERRRQLAAQFGPRDAQGTNAIRSTRASRLRTQANSESIKNNKDTPPKDPENGTKGSLILPARAPNVDNSGDSYRNKKTMVSSSLGVCAPRSTKKPSSHSTITQSSSTSPTIPRSAQLVKRQIANSSSKTTNHDSSTPSVTQPSPGQLSSTRSHSLTSTPSPNSPSPSRHPSILKKASSEEPNSDGGVIPQGPVSILKRKTSEESGARCTSPLRFSKDTLDKKGKGILKKHRSLDDPHVHNGSSDLITCQDEDPKPILKNQRRCSLEEIVKRAQSPDPPHSILKRKSSREEVEFSLLTLLPLPIDPYPHGILKNKMSMTEEPPGEAHDPRPILKKKSLSEDDDQPVRPILKFNRKSIEQDENEMKKIDEIKPILKHSLDDTEVEQAGTAGVVMRTKRSVMHEKRVVSLDLNIFRTRKPSLSKSDGEGSEGGGDELGTGSVSVAERVNGLESFGISDVLRMEPTDDLEHSTEGSLLTQGSVNERTNKFNLLGANNADALVKQRRNLRGPRSRGKLELGGRFCTQPVTLSEVEQAKRNNDSSCEDDPSNLTLAQRVQLFSMKATESTTARPPPPPPVKRSGVLPASAVIVEGAVRRLLQEGIPTSLVHRPLPKDVSDEENRIAARNEKDPSTSNSSQSASDDDNETTILNRENVKQRLIRRSHHVERRPGGLLTTTRDESCETRQNNLLTVKKSSQSSQIMAEVTALRRCATQPMPRDEVDDMPKTTIAERLAALKKNGDNNWMKRIAKPSVEEDIIPPGSPGSGRRVTERLGQLETASQGWKSRVGQQDAAKFTVAGKMTSEMSSLPPAPTLGLTSRKPTPIVFTPKGMASASVPSVPDTLAALMKRSISITEGEKVQTEEDVARIDVPRPYDEGFSNFFSSADVTNLKSDFDVDFQSISFESTQLLVQRKNVRLQKKHHKSANPLKALANRADIKNEYEEVKTGVADREIRRINIEKLTRSSGLAVEALAGLASKEDITSVSLRKAAERSPATMQWSHPILLRVKGRRHPLTSVVKPHYSTVNEGDSFILVTQNEVFHWVGEYSNVVEKSRGADIALHIQRHRDLGCTGASTVVTLDGGRVTEKHKSFWKLLELPEDDVDVFKGQSPGHPDEDEVYEKAVSERFLLYYLDDEKLLPVEDFWGRCPKIDILDPAKVLVFDFGGEVYMWAGKNVDMSSRRQGIRLGQDLFKKGYQNASWEPTGIDWLDCEMETDERPKWSIFVKVTQHMEPITFKEKFLDWPEEVAKTTRDSRINGRQVDGSLDARPFDVREMLQWNVEAPDFILEGTHLGRGKTYYDSDRMLHYDVTTKSLEMWSVKESTRVPVDPESRGQFLENESYVIRWKYNVAANPRELSGLPSKHMDTGRERVATFIWHGDKTPVVDQGAAALLISSHNENTSGEESDDLEGPTVTVEPGRDPPAFASIFPGPIVFHRLSLSPGDGIVGGRMFLITGEIDEEARLEEVECTSSSLRSRASLWFIDPSQRKSYLWHGAKTLSHARKVAASAVRFLEQMTPKELYLHKSCEATEINEGREPVDFLEGFGEIDRRSYDSLLESDVNEEWTPRLFHLSSLIGEFKARPVLPTRFHPDFTTPYPYSKTDLYAESQPSIMVLDTDTALWLWCGWCEGELDSRGSVWIRHKAERVAALTSCLQYWDRRFKSPKNVHVVTAGLEPPQFKASFSVWTSDPSVDDVPRSFNLEDGHFDGEMISAQEELAMYSSRTYPITDLTSQPLPAGVDPTRLEEYLEPSAFMDLFGMTRQDFGELPQWKRTNLKKKACLF